MYVSMLDTIEIETYSKLSSFSETGLKFTHTLILHAN